MLMGSLRLLSRDQNYSLELLQIVFSLNTKYEAQYTMVCWCYQCQWCFISQLIDIRDCGIQCNFFPINLKRFFYFFNQTSSYAPVKYLTGF